MSEAVSEKTIITGFREQYDALQKTCEKLLARNDKLLGERNGMREQHARDSVELRSLCQARDDFRKERDEWKAAASEFHLERDAAMAKLAAITTWLENNQPDVFSRGLWDAIHEAKEAP